MNGEHYADPTAETAIRRIERGERETAALVKVLRDVCRLAGYRIVGRVKLEKIKNKHR